MRSILMFGFGVWECLLVLLIAVLIFGSKRIKSLGSDLGEAVKGFRRVIQDDSEGRESVSSSSTSVQKEVDKA